MSNTTDGIRWNIHGAQKQLLATPHQIPQIFTNIGDPEWQSRVGWGQRPRVSAHDGQGGKTARGREHAPGLARWEMLAQYPLFWLGLERPQQQGNEFRALLPVLVPCVPATALYSMALSMVLPEAAPCILDGHGKHSGSSTWAVRGDVRSWCGE